MNHKKKLKPQEPCMLRGKQRKIRTRINLKKPYRLFISFCLVTINMLQCKTSTFYYLFAVNFIELMIMFYS